jgi:PAS domain S-box-containing protein
MSRPGGIADSELLRAVLAGAPVRVVALDRNGRFLLDPDPNPPVPSDSGTPPGTNFLTLYDVPGALEAVQACLAGEEVRITRNIGGANYMATFFPRRAPSGEVDSILGVATVVSEGSVVERALAEVQARERRIFNSHMVGLLYWRENGAITDANDAFLAIVGYSRDDLARGLDWQAMTPPEHRALDEQAGAEIRERGSCTPYEKQFIRKDGQRVDILLGGSAWEVGPIGGVAFVVDMTDRKRAEREQAQLQAQLREVQKLESLGLLAGGIAHDFNNILTPILGAASSALLTIPIEHPAHRDLELVISAAQRAASLTRQMLAYSGKAHVEIRTIDLSAHVREITSLLETAVPKKVQLRLELGPDLPAIDADVAQIQQVVMNLVINGAEAIGDQPGTVLVSTGKQRLDDTYASSLFAADRLPAGDYVFLEVHDTGHGMDEATRQKIFDPFFTTKFTGRGLGLAAVAGIVRSHRGAIDVHSSSDRGTTFKVFFPAAAQSAPPPQRASLLDYRGSGLVLIIDDDSSVRRAARRMLEYFGFSVIEAEDGQAGARAFEAQASEIVLVIVDMTMPKMNGEETFRALRRVRDDVSVILTSGYSEIETTRRFTSKGLAGFLEKPFTPIDLARKLVGILGRG